MLHSSYRPLLSTSFFIAVIISGGHAECQIVTSWQSLDKELGKHAESCGQEPLSWDCLRNAPSTKRLVATARKDSGVCFEMLSQPESVFVPLVGYYMLKEMHPDLAFRGAIRGIMYCADRGRISVYSPLMKELSGCELSKNNLRSFDVFLQSRIPENKAGITFVLHSLPIEFLSEWHQSYRSALVPISNEAMVLEYVLPLPNKEKSLRKATQERLDVFADFPGEPRLLFVLYTEKLDRKFEKCLVATLQDPTVSDYAAALCAGKHQGVLQRKQILESINLSETRREAIDREMHGKGSNAP